MKVMIFGDTASGKSSFAEKLAVIENLPVIHLDKLMEEIGRSNKESIGTRIEEEASKPNWIIEGNAFTKDPSYRIAQADIVYVFDFNRFVTLRNHIKRFINIRLKNEVRKGSNSTSLNLKYFVPYTLLKFPPRKKEALQRAKSQGKTIVSFRNYKDVNMFLSRRYPESVHSVAQ